MSETHRGRVSLSYWVVGLALIGYVAVCTVQRDNVLGADAWEHHRTVLTLTRHLWHPGNPTYASDVPSVRYSPYTIILALVCRATHITPHAALSIAAVINTALLLVGLWMLLDAFGESKAATAVLVVMVTLWGGAPGWANSYALADLPWQQVNPSALAFAFVLIVWAMFRRISIGDKARWKWAVIIVLMTLAMLDHGMTAAFGAMGLFVLAVMGPSESRIRMLAGAIGVAVVVAVLCTPWPWFSFWTAVRWKGDLQYWYSAYFVRQELTEWIVPGVACTILALPLVRRPLVRVGLLGGALSIAMGLVAMVTKSPTLARFPLLGLIYFHLIVGLPAHEAGIFRPMTWPGRIRGLFAPLEQAGYPILQVVLAIVLVACLEPEARLIVSKPYLLRPYIAGVLHRPDRQERLPGQLAELLRSVGENDVVLSDLHTSWLAPSYNGKIVAAIHFELFVPDQRQRWNDVHDFFRAEKATDREAIVRKYSARWIVLNRRRPPIDDETMANDNASTSLLLRKQAVVAEVGDLVLMDAQKWLEAVPATMPASRP